MSYGICAVKFIDSIPHYLMIRRRDSLSYVEFMRGKYKLDNRDYIQYLINNMTTEEQSRLTTMSFDKLWENVWNGQNTRQFRNEYETAKQTFEALKNTGDICGRLMNKYVEEASKLYSEPEWGFPKGRRTYHESELGCALREFSEETGFSSKIVRIPDTMPTLVEEYTGSNGIRYKQIYYIGGCMPDIVAVHQPANRIMNREVGNIGWYPYADAFELIRESNKEKRAMLTQLHSMITTTDLKEKLQSAIEWTVQSHGNK